MLILSGSSHPKLAAALAKSLSAPLVHRTISSFSDQTFKIRLDTSAKGRSASGGDVKGETVVIVQTLVHPVHDNLIELLLLADACTPSARATSRVRIEPKRRVASAYRGAKSAKASKIIAVIPYLCYSKQDQVFLPGEPLSVRVIAQVLSAISIDEIITLDLHHPDIAKFFSVPIHNLSFLPTLIDETISSQLTTHNPQPDAVVAPDHGAVPRAQLAAAQLHLPLVIIDKHRNLYTGKVNIKRTVLASQGLSLKDLKDKNCLLIDDLIVTGATLVEAAKFLKTKGAKTISIFATHGLFTNGYKKLRSAGINSITISDSIPHQRLPEWIRTKPIVPVLKSAIDDIIEG